MYYYFYKNISLDESTILIMLIQNSNTTIPISQEETSAVSTFPGKKKKILRSVYFSHIFVKKTKKSCKYKYVE